MPCSRSRGLVPFAVFLALALLAASPALAASPLVPGARGLGRLSPAPQDPAPTPTTCTDADSDTWDTCEGDCDDTNPSVHPGHAEVCGNGLDDNCNPWASECCETYDLGQSDCVMCDATNDYVCGPGYQILCCI